MLVNGRRYGYGEALENKSEHYDDTAPAVDIDRIYTDILLYKFINKKTKCLNVAGVRAMNEEFSSGVVDYLKRNYAKEEQPVDRR